MARTLLFFSLVALTSSTYAQNRVSNQVPSPEAVVSRVDRQVSAVERRIAQEDQRLQARMAQISKMRDAALKREDSRALKNVELLEQQAYKDYEARMNRALSTLNGDPTKQRSKQRTNTRTRSSSRTPRKVTRQRSATRKVGTSRGYRR